MIICGRPNRHAINVARYLLTPKEGEKEFVLDVRDAASDDIRKAFTDWEAIGRSKTKGESILYHAHIRLRDGEVLHEAQWFKVIQDLEEKLGFTNCPRAVIGHNNAEKGLHIHIVWSRLDPLTNKLVSLSNDRKHHHAVAREAEKEFGLSPVIYPKEKRKRRFSDREIRALKDRNLSQEKLTKIVRAAWSACDTGEEMKAMLSSLGAKLQPGDRRDWVVNYGGLKMNPVRLLDDVNTAMFREKLKDLDYEAEKQKARETSPAMPNFGKKARHLTQQQIDATIANDVQDAPPKTGFRKKRHAPQPKLRRKMFYGDPGI